MAHIEVERRRRSSWWLWLALGIAALILWLVFANRNRARDVAGAGRGPGAEAPFAGEVIRDPQLLLSPANPLALAGRTAELDNARVLTVAGNRAFWVGADRDRQLLVVLDPPFTTQGIMTGQNVSVGGTVERLPGFEQAQREWGADPALRTDYERQQIYLKANSLNITPSS